MYDFPRNLYLDVQIALVTLANLSFSCISILPFKDVCNLVSHISCTEMMSGGRQEEGESEVGMRGISKDGYCVMAAIKHTPKTHTTLFYHIF